MCVCYRLFPGLWFPCSARSLEMITLLVARYVCSLSPCVVLCCVVLCCACACVVLCCAWSRRVPVCLCVFLSCAAVLMCPSSYVLPVSTLWQAEEQYRTALAASPAPVVTSLMQVLRSSPEQPLRSLSAVLLRRIFDLLSTAETVQKLDAATLEVVKQGLVASLTVEPVATIARRVALTTAQLASSQFAAWPTLMPAVLSLMQHSDTAKRALGFFTISKLCEFAFAVRVHVALGQDSHRSTRLTVGLCMTFVSAVAVAMVWDVVCP